MSKAIEENKLTVWETNYIVNFYVWTKIMINVKRTKEQ